VHSRREQIRFLLQPPNPLAIEVRKAGFGPSIDSCNNSWTNGKMPNRTT